MIPEFTSILFLQSLDEWGRYADEFNKLSPKEQADFLKGQGYASLHELLEHVGAWWEEGEAIIRDAIGKRERPKRTYDFDEFNAAALKRFKDTPKEEVLAWYEAQRKNMSGLVSSLTEEQMKIRRVSGWLDAVVLGHLKEHALRAPRFLVLDMLEREWGSSLERYKALTEEDQKVFMAKQGFGSFREVIAHIIAWWEDGLAAIDALSKDKGYHHPERDTDTVNAEAVKAFGKLDESEVWKKFELTRQRLLELAINLRPEIFDHKDVQAWLRADVLEHYYEHAY